MDSIFPCPFISFLFTEGALFNRFKWYFHLNNFKKLLRRGRELDGERFLKNQARLHTFLFLFPLLSRESRPFLQLFLCLITFSLLFFLEFL